jgi:hypothetical protein
MTLPSAMIGPLDVLAGPVILTSQTGLPVRASTANSDPSPEVEIKSALEPEADVADGEGSKRNCRRAEVDAENG